MSELFLKLLNMSITASWLIVAVVVLRLVLKKAPKWINCVLWALVAVRLVCPFSFESRLSLVPDADVNDAVDAVVSQMGKAEEQAAIDALGGLDGPAVTFEAEIPALTVSNGDLGTSGSMTSIDVADIAAAIWLAGMVILLLYALISYLRLRRRVSAAMPIGNKVWLCDAVESPFILGFFRPRIYLPSNISEGEMEHVLAHERAHLQRRDHWWKPIGYVLLALYWFNPLIWLAYILLCRDIELACDEKVINRPETDRKAYSEALLACSVKRSAITACPLAFGEVSVRGRIKSVLNYKKPAFWIILVALIACIVAAVCFLTDPVHSVSDDVLKQNGYCITEMVLDQSMDVTIPTNVITDDAWTKSGHTFEPDEVILGQIGGTTLYLQQVRTINGETEEEYLFFVLNMSHDISDYGTIRSRCKPEFQNGEIAVFSFSMGLMGDDVRDSAATYADAGYFRGSGSVDELWVGVKRDVVKSAEDYISFRLIGFTDISYEKGDANHEDDILIRTAQELAEKTARVVDWVNYPGAAGAAEIILPEYPYTTFFWTVDEVKVFRDGESGGRVLFTGETIWNVFLADLNGDGYRDLCATLSEESSDADTTVLVHDYVAGITFGLSNREGYAYALSMTEDDALQVNCSNPETGEMLAVGKLAFTSDGLVMVSNAGAELGKSIAAEFGNVPSDYQVYYNSEIENIVGSMNYLQIRRTLDLRAGDKVPTYFLSPDKKTLIAVKQDKEGANYSWTFIKNESGEWELSESLAKPTETVSSAGGIDGPTNVTVDHSILNGNAPFFDQPLEITEDPMTYQERLDWVKSGVVYTETLENGGESSTISLGQWQEGYGCLAYVWQPYGSPHPGVCMLTIRFADGTQARLPLPDEQTNHTAKPTSMEFRNGKFVYDVQLDSEWPEDESIQKRMYHYVLDLAFMTLSMSLGQTESAANSTVANAMLAAVKTLQAEKLPATISMTVTSDRFPVYYPFGPPVFDAWDSINGRQSCRGILDHTYQKVDSIETSDTSITLKFTWQEVDWELTFYDGTDSLLVWMDGTEYYFRAIPNYEDVFLSPLGSLIRRWFDEAEFMALDGYDGKTIVIPNTGQSYLEAAQAWCEAYEGLHLKVSSGSKEFYTYVSCRVEPAEGATSMYREKGEIGENTYAFFAHTAFVPENEHALQWSMAGNTGNYEGDDPNVPNGALEYTRCGYITLEEDGWHGVIVGTGF